MRLPYKGKYIKKTADGIQKTEQAVLRSTPVGERAFCGKQWKCDR